MNVEFRKFMRTKRRGDTAESEQEIGGFREDRFGYIVVDPGGKELGYFGPDCYDSIIFELRSRVNQVEPEPAGGE